MPTCVAYCCTNRDGTECRETGLTFHKFPHADPERLRQWAIKIRRIGWIPTTRSVLCSDHFLPECFERLGFRVHLKKNAIPTIFTFPKYLTNITSPYKPPAEQGDAIVKEEQDEVIVKEEQDEARVEEEQDETRVKENHPCIDVSSNSLHQLPSTSKPDVSYGNLDHTYAILESPKNLKRKLDDTTNELEKCRKKLKMQQQKARRSKRKVKSLTGIVKTLKKQNLISYKCAEMIESTFSGVSKEIMHCILKKKKGKNNVYPEELKTFAMTLQCYSRKAYKYVRESFDLALPHPRQIRAYYASIVGEPGFTKPSFLPCKPVLTITKAEV